MPEFSTEDLHPGARAALTRHTMDESEIARAISRGELTSPQRYGNSWLFNLRITGTGAAYRQSLKEYVWRDPSLYLNQNFLDRCQGLPVIIEHPGKSMLDGKEFTERVIGMIVYPYLKPDEEEVWGIGRILDQSAAEYMVDNDLSTSPAVVFRNASEVNEREDIGGGKHLLIEGKPSLVDHLAICREGVWDKGGPPTGVDARGDKQMTDEEKKKAEEEAAAKAREDAARGDEENKFGEKIDKLLAGLDSIGTRMDAIEARHGARADEDEETEKRQAAELHRLAAEEEEEAKEAEEASGDAADSGRGRRADARARYDAAKQRFDEEHEERVANCKDDEARTRADAARKRFDAAGQTLEDAMKRDSRADEDDDEDGEKPKDADRKDGESDNAYSKRVDSASKDSGFKPWAKRDDESVAAHCDRVAKDMRRDRARRDAEVAVQRAEKQADEARSDAAAAKKEAAETRALLDEMRSHLREREPADEAAFADAQSRADAVYMALGERAPASMRGEDLPAYRARLARGLQKHSRAWKEEDLSQLSKHSISAFEAAEAAVYADAHLASRQPMVVEGEGLRTIIRRREGGGEMYEYVGDPKSWMSAFMPAEQYATSIGRD